MNRVDDLAVLHERIAALEGHVRPSRRGWRRPVALAVGLFGVTLGLGRALALQHAPPPIVVTEAGPARLSLPAPGELRLSAPGTRVEPLVGLVPLDVNADGRKDFVLPCWLNEVGASKRYVVALDGRTFEPLWTAGPFEPDAGYTGYLDGHGDTVVLTSGRSTLHVLEAASGRERGSVTIHEVREVRSDGSRFYVVGTNEPADHVAQHVLDERRLELTSAAAHQSPCSFDPATPCRHGVDDASTVARSIARSVGPIHDLTHVEPPTVDENEESGIYTYFVRGYHHASVWDGRGPAWRVPLAGRHEPWTLLPDQVVPEGSTGLDGTSLYYVYPTADGRYRLTSRSLTNGALRYDVGVEGLEGPDAVESLFADDGTLVLYDRVSMRFFDAASGSLRRRVTAI